MVELSLHRVHAFKELHSVGERTALIFRPLIQLTALITSCHHDMSKLRVASFFLREAGF